MWNLSFRVDEILGNANFLFKTEDTGISQETNSEIRELP